MLMSSFVQMKIGDLGMAKHVLPTLPPSSRSTSPGRMLLAAQHSGAGALGWSSAPGTPKAPAARTFTPGVVGTIRYTAPEVLGLLDEPQEQPSVETMLKVGGAISISDQYGTKHSVLQAHCCGNTGWLDSAPGLRALDSNLAMPRQLD